MGFVKDVFPTSGLGLAARLFSGKDKKKDDAVAKPASFVTEGMSSGGAPRSSLLGTTKQY